MGPRAGRGPLPWPPPPFTYSTALNPPNSPVSDMIFIPISQVRTVRLREAVSCSGPRGLYVAKAGQAQVVWPSIQCSRR